jgi:hypothetical protein
MLKARVGAVAALRYDLGSAKIIVLRLSQSGFKGFKTPPYFLTFTVGW